MSRRQGTRMYLGRWTWAAIAGPALLCAACEDAPTTTVSHRVDDVRSFVIGVMKDGPLLMSTEGRPFDAPTQQIERSALEAVRSSMTWTAQPQLTTDPSSAASTTLYLQLVFNDATSKPCAEGIAGGPPRPDGQVKILLSLCSQGQSLSTVRGSLERSEGPDDAGFQSLIRQATDDLLTEEHYN